MLEECKLSKMISACDYNDVYINCAKWLCSQYCMLYCDIVYVGSGHIMSLQWSGQCSQILSKRYHWCFRSSPGGKSVIQEFCSHKKLRCSLCKSMHSAIIFILHQHLSRKMVRLMKTLHFLNSFECRFSGVFVEMVTEVECWHDSFTTLGSHQLCQIQSCRAVDRSNSIIKAISIGSSVLLL